MGSPSTAARAPLAIRLAAKTRDRSVAAPRIDAGSEHDAIERARRGDRDAFTRLYRAYARAVHGVLLARLSRPADVEDAMQDVFTTALTRLDTLRDPGAFGAWLLAIARNRAIDSRRRSARFVPLAREPHRDPPPSLEAAEALALVRSLPEAYRETLLMRLVEGMSGPEIARATGLRPLSVRVNLHRGMKMLRKRLGEGGDHG